MSERLEDIKQVIANELGLTDSWKDGTYLYYLTRTKSAFSVGTVTLDDFEEIDEELLESLFNAIKPFFIEQIERVKVLENIVENHKETIQNYKEACKSWEVINQYDREQNKRYCEALEFYADLKNWRKTHTERVNNSPSKVIADTGDKAREALESESNA